MRLRLLGRRAAYDACRSLPIEHWRGPEAMTRWPRLDRYGRTLAKVCHEAWRPAPGPPTGLAVASLESCLETNSAYHHDLVHKGPDRVSPLSFPYTLPGSAAAEVALFLGLGGPHCVWTGGAATAVACLVSAAEELELGAQRMLVASADVLGPYTRDFAPPPTARCPERSEAAAALWLGHAHDPEPGLAVQVDAAFGGVVSRWDPLVDEALRRTGERRGDVQRVISTATNEAARERAATMADTLRVPCLHLAWKVGDAGATVGLLALLDAADEPGLSLILAEESQRATACAVRAG